MNTWVTADDHFGHRKLIDLKYVDRPFPTVEVMDHELIWLWNGKVQPGDHVIHLGDFSWGHQPEVAAYRQQLNGRITLVMGNHDRMTKNKYRACGFEDVVRQLVLDLPQGRVLFKHRPEDPSLWPAGVKMQVCGHVHDGWLRRGMQVNVGVDMWHYAPVLLEDALEILLCEKLVDPGQDRDVLGT